MKWLYPPYIICKRSLFRNSKSMKIMRVKSMWRVWWFLGLDHCYTLLLQRNTMMILCAMTCHTKCRIQYIVFSVSCIANAGRISGRSTHNSDSDTLNYLMFVIQHCARTDLSAGVRMHIRSYLWSCLDRHWFITQNTKIQNLETLYRHNYSV